MVKHFSLQTTCIRSSLSNLHDIMCYRTDVRGPEVNPVGDKPETTVVGFMSCMLVE